jgi:hypothetical protein
VLIRHLLQDKTVVFLHWYLIHAVQLKCLIDTIDHLGIGEQVSKFLEFRVNLFTLDMDLHFETLFDKINSFLYLDVPFI